MFLGVFLLFYSISYLSRFSDCLLYFSQMCTVSYLYVGLYNESTAVIGLADTETLLEVKRVTLLGI